MTTDSSSTLLIVLLLYISTCGTAVRGYIITAAAVVRTESEHTKSHNHQIAERKKNRMDFSIRKKEAKGKKKPKLDPR